MKKIILVVLLLSNVIWALNIPKPSPFDKRITYAIYNANDVFLVNAKNGYVSVLEFSINERIINTATGFSDGWDLIERQSLIYQTQSL